MNNKIFISGKVTGDPNYALKFESACIVVSREAFFKEYGRADLGYNCRHHGFMPVDPCELTIMRTPIHGWPWWVCMIRTVWAMLGCSYVYMLRDWKDSRGSKIEHWVAVKMGKKVIYQ